jgi:hypothetical protein
MFVIEIEISFPYFIFLILYGNKLMASCSWVGYVSVTD